MSEVHITTSGPSAVITVTDPDGGVHELSITDVTGRDIEVTLPETPLLSTTSNQEDETDGDH